MILHEGRQLGLYYCSNDDARLGGFFKEKDGWMIDT